MFFFPGVPRCLAKEKKQGLEGQATAIAKSYGEVSGALVLPGTIGTKSLQIVRNYGGSEILRIRALYSL